MRIRRTLCLKGWSGSRCTWDRPLRLSTATFFIVSCRLTKRSEASTQVNHVNLLTTRKKRTTPAKFSQHRRLELRESGGKLVLSDGPYRCFNPASFGRSHACHGAWIHAHSLQHSMTTAQPDRLRGN